MHAFLSLIGNVDVLSPERVPHRPLTTDRSRCIVNLESPGMRMSVGVLNSFSAVTLFSLFCFKKKMLVITIELISCVILVRLASLGTLVRYPSPTITVDLMGSGDLQNYDWFSDKKRKQLFFICQIVRRLVITK